MELISGLALMPSFAMEGKKAPKPVEPAVTPTPQPIDTIALSPPAEHIYHGYDLNRDYTVTRQEINDFYHRLAASGSPTFTNNMPYDERIAQGVHYAEKHYHALLAKIDSNRNNRIDQIELNKILNTPVDLNGDGTVNTVDDAIQTGLGHLKLKIDRALKSTDIDRDGITRPNDVKTILDAYRSNKNMEAVMGEGSTIFDLYDWSRYTATPRDELETIHGLLNDFVRESGVAGLGDLVKSWNVIMGFEKPPAIDPNANPNGTSYSSYAYDPNGDGIVTKDEIDQYYQDYARNSSGVPYAGDANLDNRITNDELRTFFEGGGEDLNRDGRIDEIDHNAAARDYVRLNYHALVDRFDRNGDGLLSLREIQFYSAQTGAMNTDINRDGHIDTIDKSLALAIYWEQQEISRALRTIDLDGDGVVSLNDVTRGLDAFRSREDMSTLYGEDGSILDLFDYWRYTKTSWVEKTIIREMLEKFVKEALDFAAANGNSNYYGHLGYVDSSKGEKAWGVQVDWLTDRFEHWKNAYFLEAGNR